MTTHHGKTITPGVAFGTVFVLTKSALVMSGAICDDPDWEWARYLRAKAKCDLQLDALFLKTQQRLGEDKAMIVDVQRMILNDVDFNAAIETMICKQRLSAPYAVSQAGEQFSTHFSSLGDPYLQTRALDVKDLARRLSDTLLGRVKSLRFPRPAVILADELSPSEILQMDHNQIRAFVLRGGSANSHAAILTQTIGIPCIYETDIITDTTLDGKEIIVDGEAGVCYVEADADTRAKMLAKQELELAEKDALTSLKGLPTVTKDGRKIRLLANITGIADLEAVLENDSEGIGLFRSEFIYTGREEPPDEEEQFDIYKKAAEAMEGKPVIIRTLDIGADKSADYLKLDAENNPALGLRGIRLCLEKPLLFKTQLRALYRASAFGHIAIMFPMIASHWEVVRLKEVASAVRKELMQEGVEIGNPSLGIMIETPAAAHIARDLAKEVDFFSVGTNDLAQYTLALDRTNSRLSRFFDPCHPAIMEMLRIIAKAARDNGIRAGVCGELAANMEQTETLINMGFDDLSISPARTLEMRKMIREMGK